MKNGQFSNKIVAMYDCDWYNESGVVLKTEVNSLLLSFNLNMISDPPLNTGNYREFSAVQSSKLILIVRTIDSNSQFHFCLFLHYNVWRIKQKRNLILQ